MDAEHRARFITLWQNYFPGTELPITFEFRNESCTAKKVPPLEGWHCLICQMGRARNGTPITMDARSVTCRGDLCTLAIPTNGYLTSGISSRAENRVVWKVSGTNKRPRLLTPGRRRSCSSHRRDRISSSPAGTS